jgi:hypothetical protein
MRFELSDALLDDIIFSMEDQNCEFWLDTVEGIVTGGPEDLSFYGVDLGEDDGAGGLRYISLPKWDSSEGFNLMERFAVSFRNPLIQKKLTLALNKRKGVFRAFKDTLARYPEAEKLWFSYKEKEMKREVLNWYNGLREEWGLEKIGMEPEDSGDLVLEDFRFRPLREEDIFQAAELHRQCLAELKDTFDGTGFSEDSVLFEKALSAEYGDGELAG